MAAPGGNVVVGGAVVDGVVDVVVPTLVVEAAVVVSPIVVDVSESVESGLLEEPLHPAAITANAAHTATPAITALCRRIVMARVCRAGGRLS